MNHSSLLRAMLPIMVMGCALNALAATEVYQPSITVVRDDVSYDVNADGSFSKDQLIIARINDEQGITAAGQSGLEYIPSMQDIQVLEAYTTTPDGKRIDVGPEMIKTQKSVFGLYTQEDAKVKMVAFPALATGGTVTLHTRTVQNQPYFPGYFDEQQIFPRSEDIQSAQVVLRAPAALKLSIEAIDLAGGEVRSDQPGRKMWRWQINNARAQAPEENAPAEMDFSPRVVFSSFPDYPALGEAYMARARAQTRVTPQVQALADRITHGIPDKKAQAEALYRWVSGNIRYVALYLDAGGLVPHAASEIAEHRYGDCKDHVTILGALLAAKGIRSAPVLVNTSDSYWLPHSATRYAFNHVISYLPDFNLFVDSTAELAPFGELPGSDRGKSALLLDNGAGQAQLVQLPSSSPADDRIAIDTQLTLDQDGTMHGASAVSDRGRFQFQDRQWASQVPAGTEAQWAGKMLSRTRQSGTGSYQLGEAHDLTRPFTYHTQFTLPAYTLLPGPGAFTIPRGIGFAEQISEAFNAARNEHRATPYLFTNAHRQEVTRLELPPGLKVTALPKGVRLDTPFGHYASNYELNGTMLTISRTLDLDWPSGTLSPQDYPAYRRMGLAVAHDIRAQILYR